MKEGWGIRKLGEIGVVVGGSTPKTNVPSYWGEGYYWITPAELDGSKYVGATARTITDEALKHTNLTLLPVGTVLLSSRAPIGKVAITTVPMYCNQGFKNIICGPDINNEFVYWFLNHNKDYLVSLGRGATFKEISKHIVEQVFIPVPPLQEQVKIADELNCLSSIIEKKKQQLKELDKLAQSIFYEMFGDIAHNSKQFPVEKICDLGELARGVSKHRPRNAPELLGGEMPLIQTGDVANADLFIREYHSTYSALGVSQSRVWEKGTICITIAANIGNCAILSFRACFPDSVVGFIHNDKLSLFYALFVFNNLQALLEEKARGIAQKNINLQILNELLIPVPPRYLQDLFALTIEAIEKQKELVKQSIIETETLFNSRMDFWFNN